MKQNRNEEIIQEALVRNYDKYYKVAYSYVHNEADAMDIVQESAYKAILKSDTLRTPEFVNTWLYRIVINEACTMLRKIKGEFSEIEENQVGYEDTYANMDLHQALENLSEQERTLIVLRYFEDKKLDEIAEILELNINTVKSRLYRVCDKLKLELAE